MSRDTNCCEVSKNFVMNGDIMILSYNNVTGRHSSNENYSRRKSVLLKYKSQSNCILIRGVKEYMIQVDDNNFLNVIYAVF